MCAEFSSTGEYFATGSTDEHVRVTICICSILRIMDISELILPNHISCVNLLETRAGTRRVSWISGFSGVPFIPCNLLT